MKKESDYIQEFKQKLLELKPIVLLERNEEEREIDFQKRKLQAEDRRSD
ncbi:hypothetical protein HHO41_12515 [Bacillus sp. DNRA2]|nr:hypothetical protein [Bacillus sp. DNRA2]NMD71122.1 hypothetical protein [Bacillus sp. DNRA2]